MNAKVNASYILKAYIVISETFDSDTLCGYARNRNGFR